LRSCAAAVLSRWSPLLSATRRQIKGSVHGCCARDATTLQQVIALALLLAKGKHFDSKGALYNQILLHQKCTEPAQQHSSTQVRVKNLLMQLLPLMTSAIQGCHLAEHETPPCHRG
jgi:hypothetical protein